MKPSDYCLLEHGCYCCGMPLHTTTYTSNGYQDPSTGTRFRGGLFCSAPCVKRGPERIIAFEAAVAAELARWGVRFLPQQCIRKLAQSEFKYKGPTASSLTPMPST